MRENKYQSRLKEFRNEIRRKQIENIKRELRLAAVMDSTTPNDIAIDMKLDPTIDYKLEDIIKLRYEQLCKPPLKINKIHDQTDIQINAHIRFWGYYAQQLHMDRGVETEKIIEIFIRILEQYSYQEVHHLSKFQKDFLNTLQQICGSVTGEIKDLILGWIAGAEGLRVIESCIDGKSFLSCKEYKKVYKVIELGLRSEMRQQNEDAAAILSKILQSADWDDTHEIYKNFQGLMIYLCSIVEKYYKDGTTRIYSQAIMLLLDGYDDTILDYARAGVAYSAALLLCSQHDSSRCEGLSILRVLSLVENNQMIALLLENKDILSTRFWQLLFRTKDFSKSGNTKLRQIFYSFVENVFINCNQEQADNVNSKFGGDYDDIFDLVAQCLRDEENGVILRSGLNCLKALAYYGQREDENILLPLLEKKQIIKSLHLLSARGEEIISEMANDMLINLKIY